MQDNTGSKLHHVALSGTNRVVFVVGGHWGDEGKGRVVDDLAESMHVIVRCNGGANAGHKVYQNGIPFTFHQIPSGILRPGKICVLGNGMAIDPVELMQEIEALEAQSVPEVRARLRISGRAMVVFGVDKRADVSIEGEREKHGFTRIGTTGKGIGPAYASRDLRTGVTMADWVHPDFPLARALALKAAQLGPSIGNGFDDVAAQDFANHVRLASVLRPMVCDTMEFLHDQVMKGKTILVEGANATLIDRDHGTYPYTTSSSCTIGGAITGTGLPASLFNRVIGVFKAYTTRVGDGPFPTEQANAIGEIMRTKGCEFGSTTGRPRRCGWHDGVATLYAARINGITHAVITKMDVLSTLVEIKICNSYRTNDEDTHKMPQTVRELANVVPNYVTCMGWMSDISKVRRFLDLPDNARDFVRHLQKIIPMPIVQLCVGPGREDVIDMPFAVTPY